MGRSKLGEQVREASILFIRDGTPVFFSWIEWSTFIALLRYVGQRFEIDSIGYAGYALAVLLSLHVGYTVAAALKGVMDGKQAYIWAKPIWYTVAVYVFVGLDILLRNLVTALIAAQP